MSRTSAFLAIAALLVGWSIAPDETNAQEFRLDSQVYSGDSTEPVSQNVTLFSPKLVCDFLMSNDVDPKPIEIVVFDTRQKLIVLLDPVRKMRVEIPDLQLMKLTDALRRETLQNDRAKFLVNDQYEEDSDLSGNWFTLTSPTIQYRIKGNRPQDETIIPAYLDFLDHFTRLSSSDPKRIPPFPRMRLNRTIKSLGWIPSEVQITVNKNELFRESFKATSKHSVTNGLTSSDREMINNAKELWTEFSAVDLTEYRGLAKPSKKILNLAKKKSDTTSSTKQR
jgi:hypothetical protein